MVKVKIPLFVAEVIERHKNEELTVKMHYVIEYNNVFEWIENEQGNLTKLAQALEFGYEVEDG